MSSPQSAIPTHITNELPKMIRALQAQAVATIAAAIISKIERPVSIKEALDIANDIRFAMYPAPGNGAYQAWQKTQEQTLSRIVT
jgi:hypothetical protein